MTNPMQAGEQPPFTEADFLDRYGDVEVTYGTMTLTLRAAVGFEAMGCTDKSEARTNPTARLGHLAGKVAAAGALHEDDFYLLPPTEPETNL